MNNTEVSYITQDFPMSNTQVSYIKQELLTRRNNLRPLDLCYSLLIVCVVLLIVCVVLVFFLLCLFLIYFQFVFFLRSLSCSNVFLTFIQSIPYWLVSLGNSLTCIFLRYDIMSTGYFIPIVIMPDDGRVVCRVWNMAYMLSRFCFIAHRFTIII